MIQPSGRPVFDEGSDPDQVWRILMEGGIGDGLPVIPPTNDRIEALLEGVPAPDDVVGPVPPLYQGLTPAKAAYFAVLAGIRPLEFPVVLAAVSACLDERLNLLGVQTTTGTAAVGVAIHGPICERLGLNSGAGCMSGTSHPNVRIGRAVSLTLRGVGGAVLGETDMATMGQPGKIGLCFAHDVASRFSSFHGRDSGVTVFAFSGTAEVLPLRDCLDPEDVVRPLAECIVAARLAMAAPLKELVNDELVVIPPELVASLERWGTQPRTIRDRLRELTAQLLAQRVRDLGLNVTGPVDPLPGDEDLRVFVAGGVGVKMTYLPTWKGGSRSVNRALEPSGGGAR